MSIHSWCCNALSLFPTDFLEAVIMYKVDLQVDRSTDAAIERRRAAEAARKVRILNTRSRVMGLDLSTLDQQVEEKKQQQSMARQREKAFGKHGIKNGIRYVGSGGLKGIERWACGQMVVGLNPCTGRETWVVEVNV